MLHELSHCDHMDHSPEFWKLYRQLEKQVIELDWTKSKGYVLGHGDTSQKSYLIQNTLNIPHPPELTISSNLPLPSSPPLNIQQSPTLNIPQSPTLNIPESPTLNIPESPTLNITESPIVNITESPTLKIPESHPLIVPISNDTIQNQEITRNTNKESVSVAYWTCLTCTYHNLINRSKCEICETSRNPPNASINDITNESSLHNIHQSTSDIELTLKNQIDNLVRSATKQEANMALKTIRTILGNILHSPNEIKYKKISLSSKAYQQKIAKYPNAHQILLKAGFEEDKQNSELIFNRKDYGLLWLACALIDSNSTTVN